MVAYTSFPGGNEEIFLADVDGLNIRPFAALSHSASDHGASWSPDGGKIAFRSNRDGDFEVYLYDGAAIHQLTNNGANDDQPMFCGDGRMTFGSFRDGNWEIYIMDGDGSNQTRLTNSGGHDTGPTCSPDGSQIVFNASGSIVVMDSVDLDQDGNGDNQVTLSSTGNDGVAAWSPDGSQIAFGSSRSGNWEIFVMGRDGSNQVNRTNHPGLDRSPVWSPDGETIAFDTTRDGGIQIYRMDAADGGNQRRLIENGGDKSGVAFRPLTTDIPGPGPGPTPTPTPTPTVAPGRMLAIAGSLDGSRVYASKGTTIYVLDTSVPPGDLLDTPSCTIDFKATPRVISDIDVGSNGRIYVVARTETGTERKGHITVLDAAAIDALDGTSVKDCEEVEDSSEEFPINVD